MQQVFEALMLVCFGISWPISVVKSIKSGTAKGKSIIFTVVIIIGYICGIIGKVTGAVAAGIALPYVFWLYILNLVIVSVDFVVTLINKRKDKMREAENKD